MNINTKLRYALRALIYLFEKEDKMATISEISKNEKLSARYLENIFYKLSKEGIIKSKKGKKGGFFLAKDPKDINIYDLYVILAENKSIVDCILDRKKCEKVNFCKARKLWIALDKHINEFLKNMTFDDLIKNKI
ncbi:MAG: Rrf2 family transcriptional regulator [Spirochaetes bacterium]|nr:Rrf2 family transcriptional regulator [Spirochaetota bacterium]